MSLEVALSGLKRYRLRTALSLFGLAIGVGALLVTVAIGSGAHRSIQNQIRAAGLNVIVVKAGNYKTKGDEIIEVLAPHARLERILRALVPGRSRSSRERSDGEARPSDGGGSARGRRGGPWGCGDTHPGRRGCRRGSPGCRGRSLGRPRERQGLRGREAVVHASSRDRRRSPEDSPGPRGLVGKILLRARAAARRSGRGPRKRRPRQALRSRSRTGGKRGHDLEPELPRGRGDVERELDDARGRRRRRVRRALRSCSPPSTAFSTSRISIPSR